MDNWIHIADALESVLNGWQGGREEIHPPLPICTIEGGDSMQGKTNFEIAHFIGCDLLRVQRVTNSYSSQRLKEVWESVRIKNEHRAKPPTRIKGFITPHEQGSLQALEQRGNFIDSQEGQEALERLSQSYEAQLPERYLLSRAIPKPGLELLGERRAQ